MGFDRILAVDIGTSSLKAAVMNADGTAARATRHDFPIHGGRIDDFRAQMWVEALRMTVPGLVDGLPVDAVVLSGQGPTVIGIDAAGTPVEPPVLWTDRRRVEAVNDASWYAGRFAWIARRHPDAARVRTLLPFPEYLVYWLTGVPCAFVPSAEFEPAVWSADTIAAVPELDGLLPPFITTGEVVGSVLDTRAQLLGLDRGVPVVAGGSDFLMSLIGTNTVRPGDVCDRAGTSEGLNFCSDTPVRHDGLRTLPHAVPGYYNVGAILASTGLLFEWFRRISGQVERSYELMMDELLGVPLDGDVPWFFPSIGEGSTWEFERGVFADLGSHHDRAAMGMAVVQSLAFGVRRGIDLLNEAGLKVEGMTACGGQARNVSWTQLKADLVGVPIDVPEVIDAELVGNLCAGLVGVGRAPSLATAAAQTVRIARRYEPNMDVYRAIGDRYREYHFRFERFSEAMKACEYRVDANA